MTEDFDREGLIKLADLILAETTFSARRISLPFEVEYSLQRFIEAEIELQTIVKGIKEGLKKRCDFNIADIYTIL